MNYPVTRKQLQTYDPERKKDTNIYFHGALPCHDFQTHLKQYCALNRPTFEGDIQRVVEELCYDFPEHLYHTCYSKKYVFIPIHNNLSSIAAVDDGEPVYLNGQKRVVMNAILEKLKEVFIDCSIATDKTYSYVYIDWSENVNP